MGNNVRRNILQCYAIIGSDATSFFYANGKINPVKRVLKKSNCLGLNECLGENKSMCNADVKNFLTFIQTVPYDGNMYEASVITKIIYMTIKKLKVP